MLPDRRLRLPDAAVHIDGVRVRATTLLAYAGACQLTLSTAVPELGVELHSSYLGHPDSEAAVSHLALRPDSAPATATELQPGAELPVGEERRRCLYSHLAQLQCLLEDATAGHVTIDLTDGAIALVNAS